MKNLRNILSAGTLIAAIALGTTFANAGIIINNRNAQADTKSESSKTEVFSKAGIIINNVAGIIINNRTGIIINN